MAEVKPQMDVRTDLTSALLALLDTVPAHQKLYPELYVDKIVELVNKKKEF